MGETLILLFDEKSFIQSQNQNQRKIQLGPIKEVRQAFLELIVLMPECPDFESDSVEHKEKRRDLAKKSRAAAIKYGSDERKKLIALNHQYMLRARDVPQLQLTRNTTLTQRCEEEVVVDLVRSTHMESDRSVIVEDKCNIKNSLEKRILEEYNEIESNPSSDFTCLTLSWKQYEWQYAIRGPSETEFEGGIYHGIA